MTNLSLYPNAWTEIVSGEQDHDVVVRSDDGAFHVSLFAASEQGATVIAVPPLSSSAWAKTEVARGIRAYAKAIGTSATADVSPVAV